MAPLRETRLVHASVVRTASFLDAARALFGTGISAIAVVDDQQLVVGLFTDDDLLRGLFPGYLDDLHHTAFLQADAVARLRQTSTDAVEKHMREPVTVDVEASALHVAERFLHSPWGALAVVENERFVGMVDEVDFAEMLMKETGIHQG